MADRFEIYEVGPRDGLQNDKRTIAAADKVRLIEMLADCGFSRIEATSFVSAKWAPQMADAAEVMAAVPRRKGLRYAVLTPNIKGYEAARAAGVDEVAIFAAASEGFRQANLNASIAESLVRFRPVAEAARADGIPLRGYVSVVTDCPFDGPVAPSAVARVAGDLLTMGCHEISLGETLGRGRPEAVRAMLEAVLRVVPPDRLAGHFHDTGGMALQNIDVALEAGPRIFDAAVWGTGRLPLRSRRGRQCGDRIGRRASGPAGLRPRLDMGRLRQTAAFARKLRGDA